MSSAISKAINLLQEHADSIRDSHTIHSSENKRWGESPGDIEGKKDYENHISLIKELKKFKKMKKKKKSNIIIDMILSSEVFNGHYQQNIYSMNLSDLKRATKKLEKHINHPCRIELNPDSINGVKYWSGSIYIVDAWQKDEHPNGHTDKLALSIDKVIFD